MSQVTVAITAMSQETVAITAMSQVTSNEAIDYIWIDIDHILSNETIEY